MTIYVIHWRDFSGTTRIATCSTLKRVEGNLKHIIKELDELDLLDLIPSVLSMLSDDFYRQTFLYFTKHDVITLTKTELDQIISS